MIGRSAIVIADRRRNSKLRSWRAADDHGQRQEIASDGVEYEAKRLQCDGAQERRVSRLGEDHGRCTPLVLVEEQRIAAVSFDYRSVGEPKALTRMRSDAEPRQDIARDKRVDSTRVDEEINRLASCRIGRIRNVES